MRINKGLLFCGTLIGGIALTGAAFASEVVDGKLGQAVETPPATEATTEKPAQDPQFVTGLELAQDEKQDVNFEVFEHDPTVAQRGKSVFGFGAEYWYIRNADNSIDVGNSQSSTGTATGQIPGAAVWFGTDKFTLHLNYRTGNIDTTKTHSISGTPVSEDQDMDEKEFEVRLRYLFRDTTIGPLLPYVIGGINRTQEALTRKIKTAGWVWSGTGTAELKSDTTKNTGMIGVGGILPLFADGKVGLRGDVAATYTERIKTYSNLTSGNQTYVSYESGLLTHLTAYWQIYKGLNMQLGVKYLYSKNIENANAGETEHLGAFASLGYTIKF